MGAGGDSGEGVTTGGTRVSNRREMVGQTKRKEKKNYILQASNFNQVSVPTPTIHYFSVTHNFYFSADWFAYTYGVSSSQKYQHLHHFKNVDLATEKSSF